MYGAMHPSNMMGQHQGYMPGAPSNFGQYPMMPMSPYQQQMHTHAPASGPVQSPSATQGSIGVHQHPPSSSRARVRWVVMAKEQKITLDKCDWFWGSDQDSVDIVMKNVAAVHGKVEFVDGNVVVTNLEPSSEMNACVIKVDQTVLPRGQARTIMASQFFLHVGRRFLGVRLERYDEPMAPRDAPSLPQLHRDAPRTSMSPLDMGMEGSSVEVKELLSEQEQLLADEHALLMRERANLEQRKKLLQDRRRLLFDGDASYSASYGSIASIQPFQIPAPVPPRGYVQAGRDSDGSSSTPPRHRSPPVQSSPRSQPTDRSNEEGMDVGHELQRSSSGSETAIESAVNHSESVVDGAQELAKVGSKRRLPGASAGESARTSKIAKRQELQSSPHDVPPVPQPLSLGCPEETLEEDDDLDADGKLPEPAPASPGASAAATTPPVTPQSKVLRSTPRKRGRPPKSRKGVGRPRGVKKPAKEDHDAFYENLQALRHKNPNSKASWETKRSLLQSTAGRVTRRAVAELVEGGDRAVEAGSASQRSRGTGSAQSRGRNKGDVQAVGESGPVPTKKRRGRPPGSKNGNRGKGNAVGKSMQVAKAKSAEKSKRAKSEDGQRATSRGRGSRREEFNDPIPPIHARLWGFKSMVEGVWRKYSLSELEQELGSAMETNSEESDDSRRDLPNHTDGADEDVAVQDTEKEDAMDCEEEPALCAISQSERAFSEEEVEVEEEKAGEEGGEEGREEGREEGGEEVNMADSDDCRGHKEVETPKKPLLPPLPQTPCTPKDNEGDGRLEEAVNALGAKQVAQDLFSRVLSPPPLSPVGDCKPVVGKGGTRDTLDPDALDDALVGDADLVYYYDGE